MSNKFSALGGVLKEKKSLADSDQESLEAVEDNASDIENKGDVPHGQHPTGQFALMASCLYHFPNTPLSVIRYY